MKNRLFALACALALVGAGGASAEPAATAPTVVELFTSQGCSSCPPADSLLGELADRDDVIALGYHIDYWDYIGWVDPFGLPEATARQRSYGRSLGLRSVFTPQMVVDGKVSVIGSRRREVNGAIAAAPDIRPQAVAVAVERIASDRVSVTVEGGQRPAGGAADVVLVRYDSAHVTEVARGENHGRTLDDANVVRHVELIGQWQGAPLTLTAAIPAGAEAGGCVVLVQQAGHGPSLGAARLVW